jgi:hypothetical protein
MFFFKKPKVNLDCFTSDPLILKTAPVDFATKHFPDWWKALPNSYMDEGSFIPNTTMKKCAGMIDYYSSSIVIPLWSELIIDIDNQKGYRWQFADGRTNAVSHDQKQHTGFASDGYAHFKILSPWYFQTNTSMGWLYSNAVYNLKDPTDFYMLPGVIDHSKQTSTNMQLLLDLHRSRVVTIDVGQPIAHITPLTEKEVVIHRHLVSESEIRKFNLEQKPISFIGNYSKRNQLKKKFSSCPFKNHT